MPTRKELNTLRRRIDYLRRNHSVGFLDSNFEKGKQSRVLTLEEIVKQYENMKMEVIMIRCDMKMKSKERRKQQRKEKR